MLPIPLAIAPLQGRRSPARRGPDRGNEAPGCFSPTQKILGKLRQREKKSCMGLLFSFVAVQNKTTSELVVCSNPRRDITCYPLQGLEIWHRITISGSHSKWLLIFLPTYSRYPWTGLCTLSYLFGRSYYPLATGSLCIPVLCVRFSLPYLHNTLYTKNH